MRLRKAALFFSFGVVTKGERQVRRRHVTWQQVYWNFVVCTITNRESDYGCTLNFYSASASASASALAFVVRCGG